jgi:dihydrofolate reductase
MSKVILDMAMSLDGFVGTVDGRDGGLHGYFFSPSTETATVMREAIASTGAIIMGRRSYDLGAQHDGFADSPYTAAQFVVTHEVPTQVARGAEAFVFVTGGIESALEQAQLAAADRDVVIGGGPNVAQQFLKAGLIDELYLHVPPKVLGNGMRLFDLSEQQLKLTLARAVAAPDALHLLYLIDHLAGTKRDGS